MRHFTALSIFALAFLLPVSGEAAIPKNSKKQQAAIARHDTTTREHRRGVPKKRTKGRHHHYDHGDFWMLIPGINLIPFILRG